jgi:hypothetical protein
MHLTAQLKLPVKVSFNYLLFGDKQILGGVKRKQKPE